MKKQNKTKQANKNKKGNYQKKTSKQKKQIYLYASKTFHIYIKYIFNLP